MPESTTKSTKDTKNFDELSGRVIGCALDVHRTLGPGLLESTYEQCLAHELSCAKLLFRLQAPLPIAYKRVHVDCGYRIDVLVENKLIVELKSIDSCSPSTKRNYSPT
jgi:GxxExxY protein